MHLVDVATRAYRESTVQALHDAARIADALDNIHFVQRRMVCRDIADNREMDLNTLYACCAGTTKHVGASFTEAGFARDAMEMLHLIAGGEDKWRARPFVGNSNCFVVPPMKFAHDACLVMEECTRSGMPMLLLSAGQAGATAPAPIAGAIVQATAECLAGLVYVNAMRPGHPAIFGTWPFVSDLRTGAMSGGSGEQPLLSAGCAQMHKFYGLPGGAVGSIADAKLPDMQAGRGITLARARRWHGCRPITSTRSAPTAPRLRSGSNRASPTSSPPPRPARTASSPPAPPPASIRPPTAR